MKKSIGVLVVALTVVAGYLIAESVSKPTLALSKVSPSGGMEMRDMIIDDLDTLATAISTSAKDGGAGSFTTLAATGNTTLTNVTISGDVKVTKTTSVGSGTATLTNAPAAGNPVVWINVMVGTNTYVVPGFAAE